jgi:hypothetical protein
MEIEHSVDTLAVDWTKLAANQMTGKTRETSLRVPPFVLCSALQPALAIPLKKAKSRGMQRKRAPPGR